MKKPAFLAPEAMLGRRLLSLEFLGAVAGLLVFTDPLAIALVAGGYFLSRSFRKMYRPAFGGSSFLTTEFVVLLAGVGKLWHLGAPQSLMAGLLAVSFLGRGLVKKLAPGPKSGQHIHL